MHGWAGKILNVDLTSGSSWREDIRPELLHEYLGGRGLGVRLLRDRFQLDPFDPDIPLIFATSPLCGTAAPTSARLSVVSRSPLTACRFAFLGATLEEYTELLTAATGIEYTPQSLQRIGERIFLAERFYNCANGFSAAHDRLPERFYCEPGTGGEGIDIPPIDRLRFNEELQKYYRIRGLTADGTFADDGFLKRLP